MPADLRVRRGEFKRPHSGLEQVGPGTVQGLGFRFRRVRRVSSRAEVAGRTGCSESGAEQSLTMCHPVILPLRLGAARSSASRSYGWVY